MARDENVKIFQDTEERVKKDPGLREAVKRSVAAAFSNVIARYRKCFKTIELAIYCSPRDEQNYNIFKREIDTTLR